MCERERDNGLGHVTAKTTPDFLSTQTSETIGLLTASIRLLSRGLPKFNVAIVPPFLYTPDLALSDFLSSLDSRKI